MGALISVGATGEKDCPLPRKNGPQGVRPPYLLPVHCLQLFYNLSDSALEGALYEVESMRRFAGLKLDRILDESTI